MSFPKILLIGVVGLFALIAVTAVIKGGRRKATQPATGQAVALSDEVFNLEESVEEPAVVAPLPEADRMEEFFTVGRPKLPIVETVTYSRKVPWLEGKAAWVVDYARHYDTSRHFIARSLNGCRNYDDQRVSNGDRFNVFKRDYPVSFHIVVDTSRCKMWVYYLDETTDERVLVKSLSVGLGRKDERALSGLLTPHGTYMLGENVATYREGSKGLHDGMRVEMRTVFGTRWIPLGREAGECTASSKGLGLHGCPWTAEGMEDSSGLGLYSSDGCIRLATEDMEELFSVIITKPTTIYIVPDFYQAALPGKQDVSVGPNRSRREEGA